MVKNLPAMYETQIRSLEPAFSRGWLSTPEFLLGELHGQRSLRLFVLCKDLGEKCSYQVMFVILNMLIYKMFL